MNIEKKWKKVNFPLEKQLQCSKLNTFMKKCEICNENKLLKNFEKLKKYYKKQICSVCFPSFIAGQKNKSIKNDNVNYRLKKSLALCLRNVIKNKNNSIIHYLGCNIPYLREWIEFNFNIEMSWENYNIYWTIVHLIPIHSLDLTKEEDILIYWNWKYLYPVPINTNPITSPVILNTITYPFDLQQITCIIKKLEKFKEEGSTTKWFSGDFLLNTELVNNKKSS